MKKSTFVKPELSVEDLTKALYQANLKLSETNQKLIESESKRQELFTNISHDLRSPITTIKSHIEYLLDFEDISQDDLNDSLSTIKNKIQSIETMIEDIFLMNRLDHLSDQALFTPTVTNISAYLTSLFKSYQDDQRVKDRNYSFSVEPSCHIEMLIDSNLLTRAIDNIISNAIKFTHTNDQILAKATIHRQELIISIMDSGIGIKDEHIEHIFTRSFQVDSARTPINMNGCGLGLSIVSSIINLHKGSVSCESTYEKGSTFIITLPINLN